MIGNYNCKVIYLTITVHLECEILKKLYRIIQIYIVFNQLIKLSIIQ
jgi:hypothetical protein